MNACSDTELSQLNKAQIRTYLEVTINLCVKFTFPTRYGPDRNKTFFLNNYLELAQLTLGQVQEHILITNLY